MALAVEVRSLDGLIILNQLGCGVLRIAL